MVIDAHVHLPRTDGMKPALKELVKRHPAFQTELGTDPAAFLDHMDEEGIEQAWLISYSAALMGYGRAESERVWDFCKQSDRLVAVGGYEPTDGDPADALATMRNEGVRVLKVHPVHQGIDPNDARLHGLYDAAREPIIFHTGPSVFPGARNDFADPALLEPVLRDWPDVQVIIGHGGRPDKTSEALRLMAYPNAWLDLSGCPPQRLADYFGDLAPIADRVLWGTDWPGPGVPGMGANVAAFRALGYSEDVQQKILHDNAAGLLG